MSLPDGKILCAVLLLACATFVPDGVAQSRGQVDFSSQYFELTDGFGQWRGFRVGGILSESTRNNWFLETNFFERFGDRGFFYKAQNSRDVGDRWLAFAALAVSSGGFFIPRYAVDAGVGRKWGAHKLFVTRLGLGAVATKDDHRDYSFSTDLALYAMPGLILQANVRWNYSTPGDAVSRYQYIVATRSRPGSYAVNVRYGFGREAYLVMRPLNIYTDFDSSELGAEIRHWVHSGWGYRIDLSLYRSRYYRRTGVTLAIFRDF